MLTEAYKGELLTVQAVATRLRLHPMTVRKKIAAGELPAVQIGGKGCAVRIFADELDMWLRDQRDVPEGDGSHLGQLRVGADPAERRATRKRGQLSARSHAGER